MEEIKVNEYVRTKEGYIARLIHYGINEGINGKSCLFDKAIRDISCLIYDEDNFLFDSELKKYIVKHSPNVIDIIEEGDYVNGKEVVYDADASEMYNGHKTIGVSISNNNSTTWTILDTEIRDIVTKEQFNQMKYIVGDESNVKD